MAAAPRTDGVTSAGRRQSPWAIIAAVLLPPLGVWLSEGLTLNFWVAAALTLIAFVPGIVFALVVVLRPGLIRLR